MPGRGPSVDEYVQVAGLQGGKRRGVVVKLCNPDLGEAFGHPLHNGIAPDGAGPEVGQVARLQGAGLACCNHVPCNASVRLGEPHELAALAAGHGDHEHDVRIARPHRLERLAPRAGLHELELHAHESGEPVHVGARRARKLARVRVDKLVRRKVGVVRYLDNLVVGYPRGLLRGQRQGRLHRRRHEIGRQRLPKVVGHRLDGLCDDRAEHRVCVRKADRQRQRRAELAGLEHLHAGHAGARRRDRPHLDERIDLARIQVREQFGVVGIRGEPDFGAVLPQPVLDGVPLQGADP